MMSSPSRCRLLLSLPLATMPPRRALSRLVFSSYGLPSECVRLERRPDPDPGSLGQGQVLVRMIMSPVNPADVNVVQVSYFKLFLMCLMGNYIFTKYFELGNESDCEHMCLKISQNGGI